MNLSSLYGLFNFYGNYGPHFAELMEPIHRLLGQDTMEWTEEAS